MAKCCVLFESLRFGVKILYSKNTSKNTQRPPITLLEGEIQPRAKQLCLRPSSIHFKVIFE